MKKLQLVLIVLMTSTFFIACQNSKGVSKPDDLGKYTFDILKGFDSATKDSYIKSIFTVEEIKAFGERNAETLTPEAKEDIDGLQKDEYDSRMGNDYNRIKEKASEIGISWDAIEYFDYKFTEKDQDGLKGTRGTLLFKYDGKTYTVKVTGVLIEGIYKLVRVYRLDTVKKVD